jgi:hypothetical protein
LAVFWQTKLLQSNTAEASVQPLRDEAAARSGFRPAVPSYYSPETHSSASERIRLFLEATRKAAKDFERPPALSTASTC